MVANYPGHILLLLLLECCCDHHSNLSGYLPFTVPIQLLCHIHFGELSNCFCHSQPWPGNPLKHCDRVVLDLHDGDIVTMEAESVSDEDIIFACIVVSHDSCDDGGDK